MNLLNTSIIVSLLTFLGSLIGFVNQVIIAYLFGASKWMDAYLLAASVPLLLSGSLGAALSYSMVPVLISYRSAGDESGYFAGGMLISLAGGAIIISCTGYVLSPSLVHFLAVQLDPEALNEAIRIARVTWISVTFSIIMYYLGAVHNANKRFFLPVMSNLFPYLGMIFFGITAGNTWGPIAIAWGMLVGTFAGCFVLFKRTGITISLTKSLIRYWQDIVRYFAATPLIIIAMGCMTAYQVIDAFWAPRLGAGKLSYLGYCQRILIALGSLVIAGPSVVLVPRLTEAHLAGRQKDFLDDLSRAIRMMFAFAVPVAVIVTILAVPLIEILFQRGAFDTTATQGIASLLPLMMVGMIAMLCVVLMFRALYAQLQFRVAAAIGMTSIVLYFSFSGVFSILFHVQGIALSYALSWWTTLFIAAAIVWHNNTNMLFTPEVKRFFFHLIGSVTIMGIIVYAASLWLILPLDKVGFWELSMRSGFISIAGFIIYYFTAVKLFWIPEVSYVSEKLLKSFTGPKT